jgi:hypothetical protein
MTNTLGLNNVIGGVIGNFTPVTTTINLAKKPELGEVGAHDLGLTIPAGKFIVGAFIRNPKGDLEEVAGTLTVTIDGQNEVPATAASALKGKGVAAIASEPYYLEEDANIILTVATSAITEGTITVGVIYA